MLPELSKRLLDRWSQLPLDRPKPNRLTPLGMRTQVGDGYARFFLLADREESPCLVAKIPREEAAWERLWREWDVLEQYSQDARPGLGDSVPRPVTMETINETPIFVTTAPPGRPMAPSRSRSASHFASVLDWLLRFNTATRVQAPRMERARQLQELLAQVTETFALASHQERLLQEWAEHLLHPSGETVDRFHVHGNLASHNIWLQGRQVMVTNWEWAAQDGLPLQDLFSFVTTYTFPTSRRLAKEDFVERFRATILEDGPQAKLAAQAIRNYCRALGLPTDDLEAYFGLFLARAAVEEVTMLTAAAERGFLPLLKSRRDPARRPYTRAIREQLWITLLREFMEKRHAFRRLLRVAHSGGPPLPVKAPALELESGLPVDPTGKPTVLVK